MARDALISFSRSNSRVAMVSLSPTAAAIPEDDRALGWMRPCNICTCIRWHVGPAALTSDRDHCLRPSACWGPEFLGTLTQVGPAPTWTSGSLKP